MIIDERHALYVGWALGIAHRNGVRAEPVIDDDGNYTNRLRIPALDPRLELIVPPPPDDWTMPDYLNEPTP